MPRAGAPGDGRRPQDHDPRGPCRLVVGGSEAGEAADEAGQGDLGLEAGKGRPEAVVGTATEGHVLGGIRAGEIQDVGVVPPPPRVTVGRAQAEEHVGAGGDVRPVELEGVQRRCGG